MDIVNELKMPLCHKTRIPIKTLIDQMGVETRNKKIIECHIASMYLISLLNDQTIKIRSYKDEEFSFQVVYVLEINLKANDQLTEFSELVHSAFPESTFLIMNYKDIHYVSGAYKRINKNDKSKTVIEDSVWAELFNDLTITVPSVQNLKEYYEFLMRLIYRIKAQNVTGIFPSIDEDYKEQIKKYETTIGRIGRLKSEYVSASMRNEKMRIDDELYEEERNLERLLDSLKNGIIKDTQ